MIAGRLVPILSSTGLATRPRPIKQNPLPPFDHSVPGGDVHIVLPPEQIIPTNYDRDWWRGDIGGVTLKETPPFVPGANTTPPEMTMSFLLPYYKQFGLKWIDKILTAHAEHNYSHFHLDRGTFEQAGFNINQTVDLFKYIQSWGFYTSYWGMGTGDGHVGNWDNAQKLIGPLLIALINSGSKVCENTILVLGEELNSYMDVGPGMDNTITAVADICNPVNIPVWLHFTSNVPAWPPNSDFSGWWRNWINKVKGLCWQSNPFDSAGLMGSHLWDSRKILAAASLIFKVAAFELRALQELFGGCDEDHGCLTGWEMICTTRDFPAPSAPAVAGFGNGCRYPDGNVI